MDFDSYWQPAAMAQMDRITTDDHAQFQYYRSVGYFGQTPDPYADLGELVAGTKPGRQSDDERTLAINLGLALDDMAVAPEVYRRGSRTGDWDLAAAVGAQRAAILLFLPISLSFWWYGACGDA